MTSANSNLATGQTRKDLIIALRLAGVYGPFNRWTMSGLRAEVRLHQISHGSPKESEQWLIDAQYAELR